MSQGQPAPLYLVVDVRVQLHRLAVRAVGQRHARGRAQRIVVDVALVELPRALPRALDVDAAHSLEPLLAVDGLRRVLLGLPGFRIRLSEQQGLALVPSVVHPDCLLIEYPCTRTHSPHPPPWAKGFNIRVYLKMGLMYDPAAQTLAVDFLLGDTRLLAHHGVDRERASLLVGAQVEVESNT